MTTSVIRQMETAALVPSEDDVVASFRLRHVWLVCPHAAVSRRRRFTGAVFTRPALHFHQGTSVAALSGSSRETCQPPATSSTPCAWLLGTQRPKPNIHVSSGIGCTLTHRSNELTQHTCPALTDCLAAEPLYAVSPSQTQHLLFHCHKHNTNLQLQLHISVPVESVV